MAPLAAQPPARSASATLAHHKARLDAEVRELTARIDSNRYAREWMREADRRVLALKRRSLEAITLVERSLADDREGRLVVRDLRDIYRIAGKAASREGHGAAPGRDAFGLGRQGKVLPGPFDLGRQGKVLPRGEMLLPGYSDPFARDDLRRLIERLIAERGLADLDPATRDSVLDYLERGGRRRMERELFQRPGPRHLLDYEGLVRYVTGMMQDAIVWVERETEREKARQRDERAVLDFYQKIGITPVKESDLPASVDLSSRFEAPRLQGRTLSCVAFAIATDMESFRGVPRLSVGLAYAYMNAPITRFPYRNLSEALIESLGVRDRDELHRTLDAGADYELALDVLKEHPIAPEARFPFDPKGFVPENLNAIAERVYGIGQWATLQRGITPRVLRQALAAGKPLMVTLTTDARYLFEDWMVPAADGVIGHVVNLVGYGTGVDPLDGVEKRYFLVRDSLSTIPIQLKISEDTLARYLDAIYKVTEVKVWDRAPEYRRYEPRG